MADRNSYQLSLNNCGNIKNISKGSLEITKNCLNVFYGKNGTGKSTLVRALRYCCEQSTEASDKLQSYRYRETGDPSLAPSITCSGKIKELLVFDDAWIDSHCFKQSNLHENAYELYVLNDDVRRLEKKRADKLGYLRKVLHSPEVEKMDDDLSQIVKLLGKLNGSGEFTARSPIAKAYKNGSPIEPLPGNLKGVVSGMDAIRKADWLQWHMSAPEVADRSVCPYCGASDQVIQDACREYDASRSDESVKKWQNVASCYSKYKGQLSRHNAAVLGKVVKSSKPPTKGQLDELAQIADEANCAMGAFKDIRDLLSRDDSVDAAILVSELRGHAAALSGCKLFRQTSNKVKTSESKAVEWTIGAIERMATAQADIDQISNDLLKRVADSIRGHQDEINAFLKQCGYSYEVSIECSVVTSEARILLKPTGLRAPVASPLEALSFGEKNALALMLFMHEAVKRKSALVVLDDPISSFDYDKRYGILYTLFSGKCTLFQSNLSGRTVLVTTHDPLVLKDLIAVGVGGVGRKKLRGQYLSCDKGGLLTSVPLGNDALVPLTQLLSRQIKRAVGKPRFIGYVKIRQLAELLRKDRTERKTKYAWSFDLLSDIIHGRTREEVLANHKWADCNRREVSMCENLVKELTGWEIDYWEELDSFSDCMPYLISSYERGTFSSEEKLLTVRLMLERDKSLSSGCEVLKRFADETCHIGGSYLYQLDGAMFDQVPFYVIDWCDEVVARAKAKFAKLA